MSSVCRFCLAASSKTLHALENNQLIDVYERLSNSKFIAVDGRPRVICFSCYRKLRRCHAFSQMTHKSEKIFNHLYVQGLEATPEHINQVNLEMIQELSVDFLQCITDDGNTTNGDTQLTNKQEQVYTLDIKEEDTEQDPLLEFDSLPEDGSESQLSSEDNSDLDNHEKEVTNINVKNTKPDDSNMPVNCNNKDKIQKTKMHDKKKRICCSVCEKPFKYKSNLIEHMRIHTEEKVPVEKTKPEDSNMRRLEQAAPSCEKSSISTQSETGEETIIPVYNQTTTMEPENTTNTSLKLILQNQAVLFETTNGLMENQKKILHEIASLSKQMQEVFSKTHVKSSKDASCTPENESLTLQQIKNVEDLEKMELMLSDYNQKQKMIKASSIFCSGGHGTGKNCAFRFVDVLFSRDFLCECSWAGGTRSDVIKISLKSYKKTLNFFYDVVKSWDSSYTIEDNETFFKGILRHSTKRKNAKYERISTTKRRKPTKDNKSQNTQPLTLEAVGI